MLVVVALSAGCGAVVNSKVTSFHNLQPEDYQDAKYSISPMQHQQGDLEFGTYARIFSAKLAARGVPQTTTKDADYLVFLDYGLGESYEKAYSYQTYGQTGTETNVTGAKVFSNGVVKVQSEEVPTYGNTGTSTGSILVHVRQLSVVLVDMNQDPPALVYESRVISEGKTREVATVIPAMLEAVLEHFPGESGKTRKYKGRIERD